VEAMFSLIYDEEKALQYAREEGREDGLEEGLKKGLEKGRQEGREGGLEEGREEGMEKGIAIIRALKERVPIDEIATQYNISTEKIEQYRSILTL
jgi:predicted transposase YdaD